MSATTKHTGLNWRTTPSKSTRIAKDYRAMEWVAGLRAAGVTERDVDRLVTLAMRYPRLPWMTLLGKFDGMTFESDD